MTALILEKQAHLANADSNLDGYLPVIEIHFTLVANNAPEYLKSSLELIKKTEEETHILCPNPLHRRVHLELNGLYVQHGITRVGPNKYRFKLSEKKFNNKVGAVILQHLEGNAVNLLCMVYNRDNSITIIASLWEGSLDEEIKLLNPRELTELIS